jgi:hypothetical protein
MTIRLFRLLPLLAVVAALVAGSAIALAIGDSGDAPAAPSAAEDEATDGDIAAICIESTDDCQDTVDIARCLEPGCVDMLGPVDTGIAPMCIEGPAADCVDTVEPGMPIADCAADIYPCYDTGISPPGDSIDDRCKQLADDVVACIADPDSPVSSDPFPQDVPAEPPDAGVEPSNGSGVQPDDIQIAEDIAAREECIESGAC